MKKEQKERIKDLFKNVFYVSEVKKFEGFIKVNYYFLDQCYNNYSGYKARAIVDCRDIVQRIIKIGADIVNSGIYSFNKFQFTYVINFTFNGKKYSLYISRDKNTLYAEE